MADPIRIDGFENLHLRIRTVGYPNNGESIMISLMNKDEEIFNIFTDSYDDNGYQYWISKLPKSTRIDAFIWTHPDEDHTLGIEKLLTNFDPDKKANIYLPTSLTTDKLTQNGKIAAAKCYNYLKANYNTGTKYNWNEISLMTEESIRYCCKKQFINRNNNNTLTFQIGFMLPNSAITNRRVEKSVMSSGQINDLSIFFVIELNKARYIFSGDLSKTNMQFLDDDFLSRCRFIKIPHHGSKDPIKLVDKIQQLPSAEMYSVTTIFGSSHPYDDVLDRYAEKSTAVYSTGRGNCQYGLVEIDYYIEDINKHTINLDGNASIIRPIVQQHTDTKLPLV